MEVIVNQLGGVQFEAAARGHRLLCDQPVENHGLDTGMTPPELFLSSLGTCVAYYAAEYVRSRGLTVNGLQVRVQAEKAAAPARLAKFYIEITAPDLDPAHEAGILRAARACLIHNTLVHAPAVEIALETRVPATIG